MKILISILMLLSASGSGTQTPPDAYYKPATVVSNSACETVFETSDGNLWAISDHVEGSKYVLKFDSCGTSSIEDDVILEVIPCAD